MYKFYKSDITRPYSGNSKPDDKRARKKSGGRTRLKLQIKRRTNLQIPTMHKGDDTFFQSWRYMRAVERCALLFYLAAFVVLMHLIY